MAKKQTRRSVSIRGATYDRIREYCEHSGLSMSEFVEAQIASFFDDKAPTPVKAAPKPPPPKPARAAKPAPQPRPKPQAAAKKGNGNGNGDDGQRLTFDELQDAARYFTF